MMPPCPVRCGKSRRRVRARRRGALVCASCCPTLSIVRSTTSHREPACGFRPDCVAGVVGLELGNVVAKYPFERPHKFSGIQPNSGHRDYSRLSCGVAETQDLSRHPCAGVGHSLKWQELARFCAGPEMMRLRPIEQHHCSLCAGLFPHAEMARQVRAWRIRLTPYVVSSASLPDGCDNPRLPQRTA